MKTLTKLSIALISVLLLSACSNRNNMNLDSSKQTNNENHISAETSIERYKLVVLPTQVNLTTQNMFPISPSSLSSTLSHEITTALYETHRFDILANEEPTIEQTSSSTPQVEHANFYLQSTLNQLDSQEIVRMSSTTGQDITDKIITATILYQIIDAKSNKVVFSHSLNYQLQSTSYNETLGTAINNTLQSIANLMTKEIINEIYPIRLLSADNNQIIIDYPLSVGSQCQVMRLGKKIKDSYTDSLLGYTQSIVGKLQITDKTSVVSYAEVIDGEANKGDICKPIQAVIMPTSELAVQTPQSNIPLPFNYNN